MGGPQPLPASACPRGAASGSSLEVSMILSRLGMIGALLPSLLALSACSGTNGNGSNTTTGTGTGGGNTTTSGTGTGGGVTFNPGGDAGTGGSTMMCEHVLHAVVRDRSPDAPDSNPDFENSNEGDDTNI